MEEREDLDANAVPVLVLDWIDGPNLADVTLAPSEMGGVVAAVATIVSDLHGRGVVHGALRPEHVLLAGGTSPRLCGFGTAATREANEAASPSDDVYDLALLLREALARWRAAAGQSTGHRPGPERALADALERIARKVMITAPGRRGSARELAAELSRVRGVRLPEPAAHHEGVPAERAEVEDEPLRPPPALTSSVPEAQARGWWTAAAALCVAASVAVAGLALHRLAEGRPARPAVPSSVSPTVRTTVPTTRATGTTEPRSPIATTTSAAPPGPACAKVADGDARVDVDGDGCDDGATLDGRRIRTAAGVFEVGEAGDAVALGDWDCDGWATPAVVRSATGRVFVFRGWPGTDPLAGASVATISGATAAHAVAADGKACDQLVVERAGGPSEVVALERP
jgi:serine/threonine protein kinase